MKITTMLELQKLVLKNVYGNVVLFEKELWKSFQWLGTDDLRLLYKWAIGEFGERKHFKIIKEVYSGFDLG